MNVHLTAHGTPLSAPLRRRIEGKVAQVGRLLPKALEARVVLERERHRHVVRITLQAKGATLHAAAAADDLQSGLDLSLAALSEQVRRRKERLRERKPRGGRGVSARRAIRGPAEDQTPAPEPPDTLVVRRVGAKPMSIDEALDQMRLADLDWLVFRNALSQVVNVLHRRPDGVVELVEPGD